MPFQSVEEEETSAARAMASYVLFHRNTAFARSLTSHQLLLTTRESERSWSPRIPMQTFHAPYGPLLTGNVPNRSPHVGVLISTDIADASSDAHDGNKERHTRIHLRYVSGGMDLYTVSFLARGFNSPVSGAKKAGGVKRIDLMANADI